MEENEIKGVTNVTRKTWDIEVYAKRAQLRETGLLHENKEIKRIISNKEEFIPAKEGAAGPSGSARAFLNVRQNKIDLESNIGKAKIVNVDISSKSGGFWCEVCECMSKDSVAYLDHINGKRHQRKIGYSMRVERSSVLKVKERIKIASKEKIIPGLNTSIRALEEYEKKIKLATELENNKIKKGENVEKDTNKKKENPLSDDNDEMLALMGFSTFKTSKR